MLNYLLTFLIQPSFVKVHRKKTWKVTRPNIKLEVGARMICRRFMKGGKVEEYGCQIVAQLFWQVEGMHYSPTLATA